MPTRRERTGTASLDAMALRGNLDSLQAAELLQLLTQSGKSGTLVVSDERKTKLLSFEKGQLLHAVHQERLPPLEEILYQQGKISREQMEAQRDAPRFDDEVVRIVDRRRVGARKNPSTRAPGQRFGRILVQQERIRQEDLDFVLSPKNAPDEILHRVLVEHGGLHLPDSAEVRQRIAGDKSLYEGLIVLGLATREDVQQAMLRIDEASLTDLLVHHGLIKKSVAQQLAAQLDQLRAHERPQLRIGAFLVAKGLVSQRQLEKALGQQISSDARLGDIAQQLGLLSEDQLRQAETELAILRLEFSPLHPILEALHEDHGFTDEELAAIVERQRSSEQTLVEALVETGKVDEATVRDVFTEAVVLELADLLTWPDERYEFFEGISLEDVLSQEPVSRPHDFTFDFHSLLLDAHYRVDELERTTAGSLSPQTILTVASLDVERDPEMSEADRRLLARIDGCRPLIDVCSVLPGNLFHKRQVMQRFVDHGWAVQMTRRQAYDTGQAWLKRGDNRQAVLNYEHALSSPGNEPPDAQIRLAIQEARLSAQRFWLHRMSLLVQKDVSCLTVLPPLRFLARLWQRAQTALEELLIRKGLARQWWTVKARVLRPIQGVFRTAKLRTAALLLVIGGVGIAVTTAAISWMGPDGTEATPGAGGRATSVTGQPREVRSPILRIETDGPIQAEPHITDSAVVFASRDGRLRSVPLSPADAAAGRGWELEIGEFGDVLSAPAVADGKVFVVNVRGEVHAVSMDGEELWRTSLGRAEPLEPLPLFASVATGAGGEENVEKLTCVAVASRDSLVLLSAETGQELYRLPTGNRILARPVAVGRRLFVGSADDHVYCLDWQERQVVWDQELDDDVRLLLAGAGENVIAVVRGDRVVSCAADSGQPVWERDLDGREVRRIEALPDGAIGLETGRGRRIALDPIGGQRRHEFAAAPSLGVTRTGVVGALYLYAAEDGFVGGLDSAGRHLWRSADSVGRVTGWSIGDDLVVLGTEEGVLELMPLKRD